MSPRATPSLHPTSAGAWRARARHVARGLAEEGDGAEGGGVLRPEGFHLGLDEGLDLLEEEHLACMAEMGEEQPLGERPAGPELEHPDLVRDAQELHGLDGVGEARPRHDDEPARVGGPPIAIEARGLEALAGGPGPPVEQRGGGAPGPERAVRGGGRSAPRSTLPRACAIRVTLRRITGRPTSSVSSKAQRVISFASSPVAASRSGRGVRRTGERAAAPLW